MARQKRLNITGGIYHVITRGLNGSRIFKDADDRRQFLGYLEEALLPDQARCYAWALLDNHIHLLLRMLQQPLSHLMMKLLAKYAVYFNHKYKRRGYLFQNRFKSILCQEETYFLELVRYIHLNPVRAGLVDTIDQLDRYPWTGHSVIVGRLIAAWQTTGEVLGRFEAGKSTAVTAYRQFILDGWNMGKQERLTGGGLRRSAGGWQNVIKAARDGEFWRGEDQILGDDAFVNKALRKAEEEMRKKEAARRAGWDLERLAGKICGIMGVSRVDLARRGRQNKISFAKGLIAYWGRTRFGWSATEIARFMEMSRPGIHKAFNVGKRIVQEKKMNWEENLT